ncbi:hypothetical protein [Pseudomonas benzenivorans]|uniref:Uncharacterized protein n=1 Tax=Pseudomonas benzenivorans TaxID=556533 RepID=A0ABY5H6F9_9PSED|nr:hypothetical protein [Pseudomonas benzenivorans]UTW07007.1 hypothetical protein KDW96_17850 [Pseudomonas benzenivorans]UTW09412.1 hypothetical protein KDW96_08975 [Pseudomonas benzenivorans]
MDKHKRLYQELIIAVALGSMPAFIAYWSGGVELLDSVVKAQMPPESVLWYSFFLPAPYLVAVIFDRYVWKRTDLMRARSAFWRSTWAEIGTALHSLWRVLTGLLLAIPVLWARYEPETFQFSKVGFFIILGLALLAQCWFFSLGRGLLEGRAHQR